MRLDGADASASAPGSPSADAAAATARAAARATGGDDGGGPRFVPREIAQRLPVKLQLSHTRTVAAMAKMSRTRSLAGATGAPSGASSVGSGSYGGGGFARSRSAELPLYPGSEY